MGPLSPGDAGVDPQSCFPTSSHQVTYPPCEDPASNERRAGSQVVSQFSPQPDDLFPVSMPGALTSIDLPGLQLLNRGKVRDVYATSDPTALLFVASDRISAYDVILNNVRLPCLFPLSFSSTFRGVICRPDGCRASPARAKF